MFADVRAIDYRLVFGGLYQSEAKYGIRTRFCRWGEHNAKCDFGPGATGYDQVTFKIGIAFG